MASVSTHTAGQFAPPESGSVPKRSNAMPSAETANGIWNLRVHDNAWWDSGKIDSCALAF